MKDHLDLLFQLYRVIDRLSRRKGWKDLDVYPNQSYSIWLVVKVYLAIVWMRWTRNLFYEKLKHDGRGIRRTLRLPSAIPGYSQLKKRMDRRAFDEALLGVLSESASAALEALGPQDVRITMMDLTDVVSTKQDRHAALGTSDGRSWYWGYKLGIFASTSGVVLGAALVPANLGERHVSARLIRLARSTLELSFGSVEVKYLLADSGFAGDKTYRQSHRYLRARLVSPPRKHKQPGRRQRRSRMEYAMKRRSPHRYRDWLFWRTPTAKRVYKLRGEIDRRLGQLTDVPFGVDRHPRGTVGVRPILRFELVLLAFWNTALADNIAHGRKTRMVKVYAA